MGATLPTKLTLSADISHFPQPNRGQILLEYMNAEQSLSLLKHVGHERPTHRDRPDLASASTNYRRIGQSDL